MSKRSRNVCGGPMKGAHRQAHERAGGRWGIYWYAWRGGELAGTGEVSMSRFHNERQHPTRGVCGLAGSPA